MLSGISPRAIYQDPDLRDKSFFEVMHSIGANNDNGVASFSFLANIEYHF